MIIPFRWLLLSLIMYAVLDPACAAAAPAEATLFPDSARIVDVSRVQLLPAGAETLKAVVILPGQTVPDSLSASLPSGSSLRIVDQSWRQLGRQDDSRIADLRKQIQNVKTEKIGILARIQALDAQIQFWQSQAKGRSKTIDEAAALSSLLAKNVQNAVQEKLSLEPDLQKTDSRIRELPAETWPALFVHLLRPSLSAQGYVQASIKLPEAREMPPGQATFLIDGAVLGRRPFSFAGDEGTFSFGVDPLVTAKAILISRKAGEKGFIDDKQTHESVLRFDLRNGRDSAIRVRVEDPLPQARDERIGLTKKLEPEPSQTTADSLIWLMEIPACQTKSIAVTTRIEVPKEMDLDLGWRR